LFQEFFHAAVIGPQPLERRHSCGTLIGTAEAVPFPDPLSHQVGDAYSLSQQEKPGLLRAFLLNDDFRFAKENERSCVPLGLKPGCIF
jgi:hypothetical protein